MKHTLLSILEEEKRLNRKLVRLANEGTMEFLLTNQEQMELQLRMENKLNFLGIPYSIVPTKRRNVLVLVEAPKNEEIKEESESVEA